jgi:hypothetical protein
MSLLPPTPFGPGVLSAHAFPFGVPGYPSQGMLHADAGAYHTAYSTAAAAVAAAGSDRGQYTTDGGVTFEIARLAEGLRPLLHSGAAMPTPGRQSATAAADGPVPPTVSRPSLPQEQLFIDLAALGEPQVEPEGEPQQQAESQGGPVQDGQSVRSERSQATHATTVLKDSAAAPQTAAGAAAQPAHAMVTAAALVSSARDLISVLPAVEREYKHPDFASALDDFEDVFRASFATASDSLNETSDLRNPSLVPVGGVSPASLHSLLASCGIVAQSDRSGPFGEAEPFAGTLEVADVYTISARLAGLPLESRLPDDLAIAYPQFIAALLLAAVLARARAVDRGKIPARAFLALSNVCPLRILAAVYLGPLAAVQGSISERQKNFFALPEPLASVFGVPGLAAPGNNGGAFHFPDVMHSPALDSSTVSASSDIPVAASVPGGYHSEAQSPARRGGNGGQQQGASPAARSRAAEAASVAESPAFSRYPRERHNPASVATQALTAGPVNPTSGGNRTILSPVGRALGVGRTIQAAEGAALNSPNTRQAAGVNNGSYLTEQLKMARMAKPLLPQSFLQSLSASGLALENPQIASVAARDRRALSMIFDHYCGSAGASAGNTLSPANGVPIEAMAYADLTRFAVNFEIVPSLVSQAELLQLLVDTVGMTKDTGVDMPLSLLRINQAAFFELLARIALLAFLVRSKAPATLFSSQKAGTGEPGPAFLLFLAHLDSSDGRVAMQRGTRIGFNAPLRFSFKS